MGSALFGYAGIGSRSTPAEVGDEMQRVARKLAELGFELHSGGANGADSFFEVGCAASNGMMKIHLPWANFNGNRSDLHEVGEDAMQIASVWHKGWERLSNGAKKLHGRNVYQVLGRDLQEPVNFVLCWTEDGCESHAQRTSKTGGTGTAISIASENNIPVINMRNADWNQRLKGCVKAIQIQR